ncbi:CaiB/BaiF CoA transferase family protein [Thermanaerovibrio acidaminovorans]|jgi:CoA:oxalate CoA-transferase|uniref:Formyl-CoA transferase n=1 Tax=Thermanaerovibrio acidaminovorans (strain ATCC 49978 / DSM 6589 / Su883) TaxID=525903 RepID=D1B8P3_THEAS|nr:CaiB/BaiF CoA-transferase family protein [Thermanaerovibrio acidaminovorans]ACZ18646.1 Formyl-CoA transferase [Thermanaerovibrio acidaminovorans DSM 6589]
MKMPLEGLVILDLTRVLAGPFATMMLSDMGARVIKVENPAGGDDSRAFAPMLNGESAYFMSINRGKESVAINLKDPKGKELLLELVKKVDVLVENFKPGTMDKLGLGYEVLSQVNPRLIYAASSGFGQYGPYSHLPAYDLIIQGMGGLQSITGPDPEHPTKVGSSMADILAGIFTVIGILAALRAREVTGLGQMVDVAMLDCLVATLENAIARYVVTGSVPRPAGNDHPSIAPFATFESADGFVNIAAGNDSLWRKLCDALGIGELAEDSRFLTNSDRLANWPELKAIINEHTRTKPTDHWVKVLREAQVPCGPINTVDRVMADPHVLARDMIVSLVHPVAGELKVPGVPIKFSKTPGEIKGPAPLLGQHTRSVLQEMLGLDQEAIDELKEKGAIA